MQSAKKPSPRIGGLSFPIAGARNEARTKGGKKQRAPRSLLEKGQEPLIFRDSQSVFLKRHRAGKTHRIWLKGEGIKPS